VVAAARLGRDPGGRGRGARLRAGGPDPRAGPGAGPDPAAAGPGLPGRRPRPRYPALDVDEDRLYAYGYVAGVGAPVPVPAVRPAHAGRPVRARRPRGRGARVRARARRDAPARRPGATSATSRRRTPGAARRPRRRSTWSACTGTGTCASRTASRESAATRWRRRRTIPPAADERLRALVLLVARILAPVPAASLSTAVSPLVLWVAGPRRRPGGLPVIRDLVARGELAAADVDGVRYVWPADLVPVEDAAPARVRILAPFDPVVWDRRRFGPGVGLGLPVRGVHAGGQAGPGLLRDAAAVAGPRDRVGRRAPARARRWRWATSGAPPPASPTAGPSPPRSSACERSWARHPSHVSRP
jgi:hypothetical protein